MSDVDGRLDRLESLVERQAERIDDQQATIEHQRERIGELAGAGADDPDGGGTHSAGEVDARKDDRWNRLDRTLRSGSLVSVLAVALLLVAAGASAVAVGTLPPAQPAAQQPGGGTTPQGQVGTADRPLTALYTQALNGGVTDDRQVTALTGPGLMVDGNRLSATPARVNVSDSATGVENASAITFGSGLAVSDDGDGTATVATTTNGGADTYDVDWDVAAIETQQGVTGCFASNDTCIYNRSLDDGTVTLDVGTSPETAFATVDYTTRDPGVVTGFSPSTVETGSDGTASTDVTVGATGPATVVAATTENAATLTVKVDERPNQEPSATFTHEPAEPTVDETVTFDATQASDPDGSIATYQWDFEDDGTVEVSDDAASAETVSHAYPAAGTYTANLTVVDDEGAVTTTTRTISVSAPRTGFESADASDLLASTTGQSQTFTFTPDSSISGGESVTINLDDPQQASPRQVDYQNASTASETGTASFATQESEVATITWVAPPSGVSDGTQVAVSVDGVGTGQASNQANPYDVAVTREDTGNEIAPAFEVDRDAGDAELSSLGVSNLTANAGGQDQTVEFILDTPLPENERLTISLRDPQSSGDVDYAAGATISEASVPPDMEAEVEFSTQGTDNATITVDPTEAVPAGSYRFDIEGVETGQLDGSPYVVGFSRGDADTASTEFKEAT